MIDRSGYFANSIHDTTHRTNVGPDTYLSGPIRKGMGDTVCFGPDANSGRDQWRSQDSMYGRAHTGRLQDFSEVEKARVRGCERVAPLLLIHAARGYGER